MTDKPHFSCCFVRVGESVLLIRKNHPDWQIGRLNGVGGACQPGESPADCARREWIEETRQDVVIPAFEEFCVLEDSAVIVHMFRGEAAGLSLPEDGCNDIGEQFEFVDAMSSSIRFPALAIENLSWLIPMAFDDEYHVHASVTALRRVRDFPDGEWRPDTKAGETE